MGGDAVIAAERFLAPSSCRDEWLAARMRGVTATTVAKAATPAGFRDVVAGWGEQVEDNAYMAFGREMEPSLALWAKDHYGLLHNDWVIQSGENPHYLATPDMLLLDHSAVGEIKTGGKNLSEPPRKYRDQMQWQMFSTGTSKCLYVFMLRVEVDGVFMPGWLEPYSVWVERDDARIKKLTVVADRLIETLGIE